MMHKEQMEKMWHFPKFEEDAIHTWKTSTEKFNESSISFYVSGVDLQLATCPVVLHAYKLLPNEW